MSRPPNIRQLLAEARRNRPQLLRGNGARELVPEDNMTKNMTEDDMFEKYKDIKKITCDNDCAVKACPICLEDFEKDGIVVQLEECKHIYHIGCLLDQLNSKSVIAEKCALCKYLIKFGKRRISKRKTRRISKRRLNKRRLSKRKSRRISKKRLSKRKSIKIY